MTRLEELIERLQAATGPDRDLDCEVAMAVEGPDVRVERFKGPLAFDAHRVMYYVYGNRGPSDRVAKTAPHYTSSLDAALTLVPDGWFIAMKRHSDGWYVAVKPLSTSPHSERHVGEQKPAAIALCIAALKARQSLQSEGRE